MGEDKRKRRQLPDELSRHVPPSDWERDEQDEARRKRALAELADWLRRHCR